MLGHALDDFNGIVGKRGLGTGMCDALVKQGENILTFFVGFVQGVQSPFARGGTCHTAAVLVLYTVGRLLRMRRSVVLAAGVGTVPGLNGGRLGAGVGTVALQARLGVGDGQDHGARQIDAQRGAVVEGD